MMQAIALSLQDSAGVLDVKGNSPLQTSGARPMNSATSKSPATYTSDATADKKKDNSRIQNDSGRKRKKLVCISLPLVIKIIDRTYFKFYYQFSYFITCHLGSADNKPSSND